MTLYVLRRLVSVVPVLILVAVASFLLVHLVPGDPAMVMLGNDATPQQIQTLRTQMGLDRSLPEQFALWVREVLRGNLGESFFLGRPVSQALLERLPATLQLALLSLFFSLLIGVPAGILAAVRQNTRWDQLVMITAMGGISIPSFWLGLTLILVFSVQFGWLPSGGYTPLWEDVWQGLRVLILPAISLGFMQAALIARMTRSSMLEVLRQDYVRTAKAKGLNWERVTLRHALKNAMIPVITTIGTAFGVLLGGAVIVEIVFTYPGLGRLVVLAVQRRDYPLVQGALLLTSVIYVVVNLAVDLLYSVFDPRITYE
ncbi:MAG TPA: ABC transporter permease [Candidatus Methylomirabilis sp.]|nr:ABC transporter permease [Candidatus Methylomirabilis sp.]